MEADFFGEYLKIIKELRQATNPSPSKDIRDWLRNYWQFKNEHFWTAVDNDLNKCKPMVPFTLYAQADSQARACHELAHLIACDDKDIFDAHWGVHEFNLGSNRGFTRAAAIKEIEVLTIEHILLNYIKIHWINWQYVTHNFETNFRDICRIIYPHTDLCMNEIDMSINTFTHLWPIEKIWRELNRKYALINTKKTI